MWLKAMAAALAALGFAVLPARAEARAADPPLVREAQIPLGQVYGRIDHLAVDLARRRLFVAELGNGTVGVLDLAAGRVLRTLEGLKEPQGVGYAGKADRLLVAGGGDGVLHLYAGDDLAPAGTLDLGEDADNIRIAADGTAVVGYGEGGLAVVDPVAVRLRATVPLKSHPEGFQLGAGTPLAYVNLPEAGQVAVVDLETGRRVAAWPVKRGTANFPMALDDRRQRVLSVFRSPARLVAFRMRDGRVDARIETCGDADDVFVDARRDRLYVSCGDGHIDVLAPQASGYRRLARIATPLGARTALFVPELDRLFLAVRASSGQPASIWVYRPSP
jgi:hypothetical protein